MTRIVHLSDPHFGTEPKGLASQLLECVAGLRPDAVVVTGDLTQRARASQYRAAGQFLAALPSPVLAVPGNHDAPLWNLPLRLIDPWRDWRRHLARPLEVVVEIGGAVIVGVNSANPRVWKDGRVTGTQIDRLRAVAAQAGGRPCLLALHHPPAPPEGEPPSLHGAAALLEACAEAGIGIVLSGHLHFSHVAPVPGTAGVLAVQAGTCLSARLRGEGHAFGVLDLHSGAVTVTTYRLAAEGGFRPDAVTEWRLGAGGWR